LVDRGVLPLTSTRLAVSALVIENHAELASQGRALEVPAIQTQGIAVRKNQSRQVGCWGFMLAAPLSRVRRHLVDLGVQVHPVRGNDRARLGVQRAKSVSIGGGFAALGNDGAFGNEPDSDR
jgi:hypothetical protein